MNIYEINVTITRGSSKQLVPYLVAESNRQRATRKVKKLFTAFAKGSTWNTKCSYSKPSLIINNNLNKTK